MKTTTDVLTGRPFRWNETTSVNGTIVPARVTARTSTHLAADRVPADLLAELNGEQA